MKTRIDEICADIYRVSTFIPEVAAPDGFTFNQFLIVDDEPLLFHCGMRGLFPHISAAVARVIPLDRLKWISFGHVEADECGAMNDWLEHAPHAQLAHSQVGCEVSVNDLANRPPRSLGDGEIIELGRQRIKHIYTPHVPHGWDAGLILEETTSTLFSGDLFSHTGNIGPLTSRDILGPAIETENAFLASAVTPSSGSTIRRLAALAPERLALMHGASFDGDCVAALEGLAADFDRRLHLTAHDCY